MSPGCGQVYSSLRVGSPARVVSEVDFYEFEPGEAGQGWAPWANCTPPPDAAVATAPGPCKEALGSSLLCLTSPAVSTDWALFVFTPGFLVLLPRRASPALPCFSLLEGPWGWVSLTCIMPPSRCT